MMTKSILKFKNFLGKKKTNCQRKKKKSMYLNRKLGNLIKKLKKLKLILWVLKMKALKLILIWNKYKKKTSNWIQNNHNNKKFFKKWKKKLNRKVMNWTWWEIITRNWNKKWICCNNLKSNWNKKKLQDNCCRCKLISWKNNLRQWKSYIFFFFFFL